MKHIGWIAMLLCMALVTAGCSNSDDQNGKPEGGDDSATAVESDDLGTGTEAAAKSMAGKGGTKVTKAVGNALLESVPVGKALLKSVKGVTSKNKDLEKAPEF